MDYVRIEIGLGDKGLKGKKIIILDGLTKTDRFAEYLPTRGLEAGRIKQRRMEETRLDAGQVDRYLVIPDHSQGLPIPGPPLNGFLIFQ
jgi:hypothetical protein